LLHVSKRIQTTVLSSIADPGPNPQRYPYLFEFLASDRDPYSQCRCWLGSGVQFTEIFLEKKSIKTYSNTPFPLILYFLSKKNKNINAAKITQKNDFKNFSLNVIHMIQIRIQTFTDMLVDPDPYTVYVMGSDPQPCY
jgi:hypothetical protein